MRFRIWIVFGSALLTCSTVSHAQYRRVAAFDCPDRGRVVLAEISPGSAGPWVFEDGAAGEKAQAECKAAAVQIAKHAIAKTASRRVATETNVAIYDAPAQITPATERGDRGANSGGGGAVALAIVMLSLALYFVPTAVARQRRCKASNGVAVVNFFLGWTLLGWVVALAWAVSGEASPRPAVTA